MTVEEIPITAIIIMIAGTEFDVVQTEGIPLVRRRHLHFDWGVELCARSGGRRPRDRWRPEEIPGRRVQFRGEFFIRLQLRLVLQVPLHLVACLLPVILERWLGREISGVVYVLQLSKYIAAR